MPQVQERRTEMAEKAEGEFYQSGDLYFSEAPGTTVHFPVSGLLRISQGLRAVYITKANWQRILEYVETGR